MDNRISRAIFAGGFRSPEGPSFDRQGTLHIVDCDGLTVYRCAPNGTVRPFVNTGGRPTGSKFHRNGHLFVADSGRGEILEISPDGSLQIAASVYRGQKFKGPNDLCFASNGDLYFTDPKGSDPQHPIGNVYILRHDGEVELFASGFQFPNGIVLSDDQHFLFLAETYTRRVHVFELDDAGRQSSRRVFSELSGGLGPDGMAIGQDGNLYVAEYGAGAIAVVDPAGLVTAELSVGGAKPTNLAFWESSLYVTEAEKGTVERLDLGIMGQVLYGLS